jgi:hypothetical protein
MTTDPPSERPADPAQPHPGFAEGEARPDVYPDEEHVGRFSEGEETLPDSPESHHQGRFSEGQEELSEADPEKHIEGRFSEGQDDQPPNIVP